MSWLSRMARRQIRKARPKGQLQGLEVRQAIAGEGRRKFLR